MKLRTKFLAATLVILAFQPASANERYCREYTKNVSVGNKYEQAYGTACMQPDGSWEIVSTNNEPVFDDEPYQVALPEPVPQPVYTEPMYFNFQIASYDRYERRGHRHYKHRNHHGRGHERGHWR